VIGAGLAAVPTMTTSATAAPDPGWPTRIKDAASSAVRLNDNPATGALGFVRTTGDLLEGPSVRSAPSAATATQKATTYLKDRGFAEAFGAEPDQLSAGTATASPTGWTVEFDQSYRGVPVFGGELKAHVDKSGKLTSVNGVAVPDIDVAVTPAFTKAQAAERALAMVAEQPSGHAPHAETGAEADQGQVKGLKVKSNELMIYRTGLPRGIDGEEKLAWVLEVSNDLDVRETVILDAQTGKTLNRWSMIAHALDRTLVEAGGSSDPAEFEEVWHEGDAFPGELNDDQQNEVLGTAEAYWMFKNTFGRDSYDGEGAPMITVNNDGRISCPNANWNGTTTNYCNGVTGDDTVAHEWGHAYTEYTSGLIYQWQAGAMNEAFSDIWGETVDMLNDRHNEGGETPDDTVLRTADACSTHTRAPITMQITAPASAAGPCTSAPAAFGPVISEELEATIVVATDPEDEAGPSSTDGCSAYTNADEVAGKWAYVDRGTCTFAAKADMAQQMGAIGIVVGNNDPAAGPIAMSGDADIYGIGVVKADGDRIKAAGGPVTATLAPVGGESDDTYRWLSGEADPAFGGAIRDMWNPNCYGDPGKVSDEEYHCSSDDGGGVHTNSGVVNRTYALLVDGSEAEGVAALGIDKAANLFWRAQSEYLTPTSYFPDLADALESSCADLTGQPINQVTLGDPAADGDGSDGEATPEAAEPITSADCEAVSAAVDATELRLDPTAECAWEPILAPGEGPALDCGEGTETVQTYSEDFEHGLAGWTQEHDFPYGAQEIPWAAKTAADVPEGHDSAVAYAPDPDTGSCAADAEDISSRSSLVSPEITVPDGTSPRLSFDHYVATEAVYDGANVKVSVNGGDFAVVPVDAYLFNAPGGTLETEAGGNTSPMAGEIAWTGTDGGVLTGSWGTSVIDLGKLAKAGDTIQVRFDMGRDGCGGLDGWYVDNVSVESCETVDGPGPTPPPSARPAVVVKAKKVLRKGQPFVFRAKVTLDGRPVAGGRVKVRIGGKVVGRAKVKANGRAVVRLTKRVTKRIGVGKRTFKVRYTGNGTVKPKTVSVKVRVVRKRR